MTTTETTTMIVTNRPGPTARQREFLAVLERMTAEARGVPPSLRELAVELGVHWTACAALARRCRALGLLDWSPGSPRTWRPTLANH